MNISIAIPYFNEEDNILQTLRSLIKLGNFANISFVLVNNNSTDGTLDRIENFFRNKKNIRVIYGNETNKGVIFARKKALDLALELDSEIILCTDADTTFQKGVFDEILTFAKNKHYNVYSGQGSIPVQDRLLRVALFPEFVKLSSLLWNTEFQIFGPYFFGACFGIKKEFYKHISSFYKVDESVIINDGGGEDILLSKRAYYMNGKFMLGKSKVVTSPRRFFRDPVAWITSKRIQSQEKYKSRIDKGVIRYIEKNKDDLIKSRLINTSDRWLRLCVDANFFYKTSGNKYIRSIRTVKNFCEYFSISYKENFDTLDSSQYEQYKRIKVENEPKMLKKMFSIYNV